MKPDRKLIEKFLKDQCTDAEAESVQAYFSENPDELEQFIPLDDWLADTQKQLRVGVSERILQRIRGTYKSPGFLSSKRSFVRYAVAASVLGLLAMAGLKWLTVHSNEAAFTRAAAGQPADSTQKPETIENYTAQVTQARLSDNSLVTLYPNSALQYLPAFEKNKRELYLKGKAKFNVSKDPSRPFTVHAAGISTTALGTVFLVTVKDNRQVSVALMEGSVKVASQHKADGNRFVVLRPGDKLVVSSGKFLDYSLLHSTGRNPSSRKTQAQETAVPAKEDNSLFFKNEPLKEVLKKIETKFGVSINYGAAPALGEKLFTGTFLEQDNLEFILKMISQLHGFKYSIEGNRVTIISR